MGDGIQGVLAKSAADRVDQLVASSEAANDPELARATLGQAGTGDAATPWVHRVHRDNNGNLDPKAPVSIESADPPTLAMDMARRQAFRAVLRGVADPDRLNGLLATAHQQVKREARSLHASNPVIHPVTESQMAEARQKAKP